MIKVSVICTAYNQETYIRDALESFIRQKTNFDYEVIVHDDASTDRTAEIIAEYARKYPDLIKPIFQKENQYSQGINMELKHILPQVKGQYIALCEGDDYWIDENKLQLQVDFLDQNPGYSACVHNSYELNMTTNKQTVMYGCEDCDIQAGQIIKDGNSEYYQTASLMYRTEYMHDVPEFLQEYFLDYLLGIYLSLKAPIRFMGRIMSVYRFAAANSFTLMNRQDMLRQAAHNRFVVRKLRQVDEYTDHAYENLIGTLILEGNYRALYCEGKFNELRKPEYRALYRQESLGSRVKMRVKQHLAPLYKLYRRIKYKF